MPAVGDHDASTAVRLRLCMGGGMELTQYRRSRGLQATYQVEYGPEGYQISRDGRLRRARDLGPACQWMGKRERIRVAKQFAIEDIERLIGMDE